MADDKKTQLGTPGRTVRPTGSQQPVAAAATPAPLAPTVTPHSKTSYLPPAEDPLIGTTIAGRYLINKKLGEGGMGAVYLAMHTILEKQVALKVLHGEFARKPDLVERFVGEAKAASRIRHENVIDISDFGSTPEGLVFFAMELLTGHDLHDDIARARLAGHLLPWSRSKKIFLQICAALSAAHAKGIVHRDLKPENVYLVEFLGDPDFVKLLDFGIAKIADVEGDGGRKLTKTGMLFGTPEYMSPEQARGEQVDYRVDIYAMGCILFQLVTGQVPFSADNFMGVLSMHLTEEPPVIAPETFDRIGAPRALAGVIDRALTKDRAARWQKIDDFANAVREVSGDPLPADKSEPRRTPSVPAPVTGTTTRARSPAIDEAVPEPRKREPTGRVKTAWTGNLRVPETAAEPPPPPKSKLPLVVGTLVVLGAGGAGAFFLTRGDGNVANGTGSVATLPAVGSAIAGSAVPAGSGSAATTPPPPEPKLPEMAELVLDSKPPGATVTDLVTKQAIGKTPFHYKLAGSKTPHQFAFHLHGYADSTVELVPDQDHVPYTETLVKGAGTAVVVVHKPPEGSGAAGSGAVTHPDAGAVTHPDTEPTLKPETGSAAKPATGSATKPPEDECDPDPNVPCLKRHIQGLGSGS